MDLSYYFNQELEIGSIPEGIDEIHFGCDFNQPIIPGLLPKSLKKIGSSHDFNQELEIGSIPEGTEGIDFGFDFNHPIAPGLLPKNTKKLILSDAFNNQIEEGSMPGGLQVIEINRKYDGTFENVPKTAKIISQYHIPDIKYTLIHSGSIGILDYCKSKICGGYKFSDVYSYGKYGEYSAVDVEPIERTIEIICEVLESIEKTISV